MKVGVLALQGDFAEHKEALEKAGFEVVLVRSIVDLVPVRGLVIPGGESTTIGKLLKESRLDQAIKDKVNTGMSIWGTCAGAILLAENVITKKPVHELKLMCITIERNAYGSQTESFETELELEGNKFDVAFIRAPKITKIDKDIKTLISYNGNPVMVRYGNMLVTTFHPELVPGTKFYDWLREHIFYG
jgi:5'-phosphate synthase pdxT subunit